MNDFYSMAMLGVVVVAMIFYAYIRARGNSEKGGKQRKLKELEKARPTQAHGVIFGRQGRSVIYSPTQREGSIFCAASAGQGKTSALLVPSLRSWTGTSYTIDISGDICRNCPTMPNKIMFVPESPITEPYNVFGVIDAMGSESEQNEALEELAFLLMPEMPNMNDNAKFFLSNGRKILTASLIAFYHEGMDFIPICEKIVGSSYQNLFREIDETGNSNAVMYINSFEGANEANTAGCKQSCDDALKLFATNVNVKNCLHRPYDGEQGIEPKLIEDFNIFVIVPDPKLTLFAPLLNIVTSQLMQYIADRDIKDDSPQILLSLDEFASLHIDSQIILDALRKYRKKKARVLCLTQNLADMDLLYGHDATRALLANFRFKVLLGGLGEVESQKFFAEMIGYKDTKKRSFSKSANSSSTTESEAKEYVIEPADLDRLGDDLILICPEGKGYMRLKKNFYFK